MTRQPAGLREQQAEEARLDAAIGKNLNGRGVFAAWNDADRFGTVRIASHGAIAWGEDLELCPDALYVALTGRSVEEIMPGTRVAGRKCLSFADSTDSHFACITTTHFHARYGEHEALIGIGSLAVLRGRLPPRARGLVVE